MALGSWRLMKEGLSRKSEPLKLWEAPLLFVPTKQEQLLRTQ
jgi:hypothetical protein